MDPNKRASNENHFRVPDFEGLTTRHLNAKASEWFGGDVLADFARIHHSIELHATSLLLYIGRRERRSSWRAIGIRFDQKWD
jgi:hypothetical protein